MWAANALSARRRVGRRNSGGEQFVASELGSKKPLGRQFFLLSVRIESRAKNKEAGLFHELDEFLLKVSSKASCSDPGLLIFVDSDRFLSPRFAGRIEVDLKLNFRDRQRDADGLQTDNVI